MSDLMPYDIRPVDWPDAQTAGRGALIRALRDQMRDISPGQIVLFALPPSLFTIRRITHRANTVAYGLWGKGAYTIARMKNDTVLRVERLA